MAAVALGMCAAGFALALAGLPLLASALVVSGTLMMVWAL